ncbi:MAG: hypothetical protein HY901_00530 [Deltaproteobacteria bacterium]|nr:hypothetical protein [Deltaproteobacteria bacterium]
MAKPDAVLTLLLSKPELALLKKLDFPCSEPVLATAQLTEQGYELTGSWNDFDSLVGWVAGEANHTRSARKADLLNDIADQLECELSRGR